MNKLHKIFKFEKLIFGDLGWGDEFLVAMIMTILVSICSMGLGIFIAIFTAWAKIGYSRILNFIASFYTTNQIYRESNVSPATKSPNTWNTIKISKIKGNNICQLTSQNLKNN